MSPIDQIRERLVHEGTDELLNGHSAHCYRAQLAALDALLAENAKQARCLSIAESALFELRGTHECRGDYYDGWASSALRKIEEIKKGTT